MTSKRLMITSFAASAIRIGFACTALKVASACDLLFELQLDKLLAFPGPRRYHMKPAVRLATLSTLVALSLGSSMSFRRHQTGCQQVRRRPAEAGLPLQPRRMGLCAPGGFACRHRLQHGYLLAPEIEDGFKTVQLLDVHRTKRDWNFYRATAQNILWPHIDAGISAGVAGHCRRPEGARLQARRVGRGRAERDGRSPRLLRPLA